MAGQGIDLGLDRAAGLERGDRQQVALGHPVQQVLLLRPELGLGLQAARLRLLAGHGMAGIEQRLRQHEPVLPGVVVDLPRLVEPLARRLPDILPAGTERGRERNAGQPERTGLRQSLGRALGLALRGAVGRIVGARALEQFGQGAGMHAGGQAEQQATTQTAGEARPPPVTRL